MISIAALLIAATASQTVDTVFSDSFEPYECPSVIATPNGPLTRALTSDIWYLPNTHVREDVDITEWENIWGHISELDGMTEWPGVPGASPTIKTIGKTQFVGAKFHVPADALSSLMGVFKHVSYGSGPNIDVAISQLCGDFEPEQAGCLATNVPGDDAPMLRWRLGAGTVSYCHVDPDTDYYLNIRFTNPETTGPDCQGIACQTTIQQYIGY